ncbi:STAS/SEC14 domain-containing protein [Tsuneonella sp. HG094]|jgi:hypothetical protein
MLTLHDSPSDVLAVTVSRKITGTDLDTIMDALEGAMAKHERVHIFVETQAIEGLEIASLPAYLTRAIPLFGKLRHFGRVAVVADQAWVRAGTRIESAMLPMITYRTYLPARRGEALAWVEGEPAMSAD